jgi:imidazolonepropionase-like amidohydrolase
MQVATRAIAAVGQYEPFGISPDLLNFPTGAQMVSGVEEARRAAREQIGRGADLIKVYADWQHPTLTVDEMRVIVEEVAAHATTPEGIKNALMAGVDSIEHGHHATPENLAMMKAKGTFLVPTVGVIDAIFERTKNDPMTPRGRERREALLRDIQLELQQAMRLGVEIASGFDAAVPARQGRNADELVALNKRVGAIETGKYADLIAVEGDPLADIAVLQQVKFVMKGGTVVKDTLTH